MTCLKSHTAPSALSAISSTFWDSFWTLSLTAVVRNVVYRYINYKLPTTIRMNRFLPERFPTPLCQICGLYTENDNHMLFSFPPKTHFWKELIFEFLWPTTTVDDIIQALRYMNFYSIRYTQNSELAAQEIVFQGMGQIWKAHWNTIFNEIPFNPTLLLSSTRASLNSLIDEKHLHKRL
ncbi:uncharacterized protein B0P05DRAFT_637858 [Gilbertella persicaria]|uniref:uncharacterized protein n=1 Tax=Gilbertella persicaria TaxID=101096 RepID=UPI002220CC20|nr:uncharacterized protein B0P05DRAFT_637858 [Gilbertella persicaria]KAI8077995.1 hypothetical protein B0P05DRAFT_637858 [Gilbertella persicaria]